jgi:23S rRNA pseudouridine1911/1915/1917 synthase
VGPTPATELVLEVEPGQAGRRLDAFLAERLGLARAQARRLLDAGAVRVDGHPVDAHAKGRALAAGSRVRVALPGEPLVPEPDAPLHVLARGRGWLAIDKPPGQPVHPLLPGERGTVLGAVLARHPELEGVGEGGLRSGVVHRLDVETSGVLLVATLQPAWERLREGFRSHRARKLYRALVLGDPGPAGREEPWLRVARHRPARVRVAEPGAPGARPALLEWRRLERFAGASLLEVRPTTGFLHQIRATLAALGHPVLGDRVYGGAWAQASGLRHLLHAAALELDPVRAASPDPPDLAEWLARLREGAAPGVGPARAC